VIAPIAAAVIAPIAAAAVLMTGIVSSLSLVPSPSYAQPVRLSGKPVAPFSLTAEPVAPPALGVPVDIRVAVETRAELEDIEVRISVDEGLSVDISDYRLY